MAYHINRKKVSRKWMYNVIKAQQEKINELYTALAKTMKDMRVAEAATTQLLLKEQQTVNDIKVVNDPRVVQVVKESTNA